MESGGGGGREGIRPLTPEEEAVKRNTDCVYFLASPLTCKKGNECEYRHSEGARINPRDCWYWMNGNCLNPKCSFRHPPLDGLFGTPGPSSGPAKPPLQTATTAQMPTVHAPYTMNKQSVPCYYFQKGHCLKGEKCPFMHGPQTSGNPVSQQVAKVSTTTEPPPANKKDSGVIMDCTMQQSIPSQQNVPAQQSVPKVSFDKPKGSVNKPVQVPPASVKPVTKAESAPNNVPVIMKSLPPYSADDVLSGIQQNPFPVSTGYVVSRLRDHQVQPSDDHRPQNGREADEFLGESSPGFDVLVDDDIEEPDYFHDEDNFGRASVQSGRNLNPVDEYEYHHNDYETDTNFERDRYNGLGEYDRYGQVHDAYGREPSRASERILERPLPERRVSRREANYDERDGSDLRHRLLKRRRLNGSRSAVSPDGRSEPYQRDDHSIEERDRGHHSRRNQRRIPRESSISARLRGRITLPRRSSPDVSAELQSENDRNRGRPRGRLSPPRPTNHQGRHHERIRRRSNEEPAADARSAGGKPTRRDDTDFLDFAGPKSLAELKVAKAMENSQEPSAKNTSATVPPELNNMKSAKVVRDSEDSLSFEGPKPLSVILKRKREAASGYGAISSSGDENNRRDGEVAEGGSVSAALSDVQSATPVEAKKDVNDTVSRLEERKDETAEEEEEGLIHGEEEGSIYDGRSSIKEDMLETDYHMEVDAMDDEDLENYDQRYGESDYEAGEGGDLKTEDDENVYQEDEDELDDEDDFAKKVGVMFS